MWTCELWESQTHTGLSSLGECGRGWGTEWESSVSLGGGGWHWPRVLALWLHWSWHSGYIGGQQCLLPVRWVLPGPPPAPSEDLPWEPGAL